MRFDYYDVRIYKYGSRYKVVYLNKFMDPDHLYVPDDDIRSDETPDGKLLNNLCRAKSNILALGLCNPWEFFVTLTLDKTKYDRADLGKWQKDFSQWIRNQRRLTGKDLKYLLIPEHHEDGHNWHMHGFMSGFDWDDLKLFELGKHPQRLVNGGYRYHQGITDKFGFCSFGQIRNKEAATKYALKYITKSMAERSDAVGAHLYYCTRGLERPELVAEGMSDRVLSKIEFRNEWMATGWLPESALEWVKGGLYGYDGAYGSVYVEPEAPGAFDPDTGELQFSFDAFL